MFSLLVVVSQCLQDLTPSILRNFPSISGIDRVSKGPPGQLDPFDSLQVDFLRFRPHSHFGGLTGTQLALLLLIIGAFVFAIYHIVMPLPPGIADRKKLTFWEISLRFSFGYLVSY